VGAIVNALDGPVALTQCIKFGPSRCEVEAVCPSRVGLHRINVAVHKALNDVSLADIATPVPAFQASAQLEGSRQLPPTKSHL
jgi:DNA-binding IscR family transcriptional regulator